MNLFRSAVREEFGGEVPKVIIAKALEVIKIMTEAEIRWTSYISKGILGFSDRSIEIFICNQANSVCSNLKLPLLYPNMVKESNPLGQLLKARLKGSRGSFFDGNNKDYQNGAADNL